MTLAMVYYLAFAPWLVGAALGGFLWCQAASFPRLARIYRRFVCVPYIISIVVRMLTAPDPGWALLEVIMIIDWYVGHRLICKHDHTKRLRDAATGEVERFGNRLRAVARSVVAPAVR